MKKILFVALLLVLCNVALWAQPTVEVFKPVVTANYMSSATNFNSDVLFSGSINPNGVISSVYFEYWSDLEGSGQVEASPFLVEGNSPIPVRAGQLLTEGLPLDFYTRGNYNVRLKVVNSNGTFYSSTFQFNPVINLGEKLFIQKPCSDDPSSAIMNITNNHMLALSVSINDGANVVTKTLEARQTQSFTYNKPSTVHVYINYPNRGAPKPSPIITYRCHPTTNRATSHPTHPSK